MASARIGVCAVHYLQKTDKNDQQQQKANRNEDSHMCNMCTGHLSRGGEEEELEAWRDIRTARDARNLLPSLRANLTKMLQVYHSLRVEGQLRLAVGRCASNLKSHVTRRKKSSPSSPQPDLALKFETLPHS